MEYELVRSPVVLSLLPQMSILIPDPDAISRLPQGFQAIARSGLLSDPILLLIMKMADKSHVYDGNVWTAPRSTPEATSLDLATTFPGLTSPNDAGGPALSKLVCLVLMRTRVDLVILPALRSPSCMSNSITLELTEQILLRRIPAETEERECLLWIWLMTLECWAVDSVLAKRWFGRVVSNFPEVALWELKDFEAFGNRYLWTEHLSKVMKRYCGQLQAREKCSNAMLT
jgi:hypothetical protein